MSRIFWKGRSTHKKIISVVKFIGGKIFSLYSAYVYIFLQTYKFANHAQNIYLFQTTISFNQKINI